MNNKKFRFGFLLLAFLFVFVACSQMLKLQDKPLDQGQTLEINYDKETKDSNNQSKETNKNETTKPKESKQTSKNTKLDEHKAYYTKEDVIAYLIEFDKLPKNYLTKNEAMDLGWDASRGNLWKVTDKGVIGGDRFGNREGKLPKAKGRKYFEADVNYKGGNRNAERIVFSNDGLIFYTKDHYKTFEEIRTK